MKTIAFFNNKGGVGKTTLVYHLAWMLAEQGSRVLAVDLDPQANLTSMFLDEEALESLWPNGEHPKTVYGSLRPIIRGTGDVDAMHVEKLTEQLGLIVGDLALSTFEDRLSEAWPRCHNRDESAFRVMTAFYRGVLAAARTHHSRPRTAMAPPMSCLNRWTSWRSSLHWCRAPVLTWCGITVYGTTVGAECEGSRSSDTPVRSASTKAQRAAGRWGTTSCPTR